MHHGRVLAEGVAFHIAVLLAIFSIYFTTPILQGIAPEASAHPSPPASRVVLISADGMRADALFGGCGPNECAFLHGVAATRGRWGVSHTHVRRIVTLSALQA